MKPWVIAGLLGLGSVAGCGQAEGARADKIDDLITRLGSPSEDEAFNQLYEGAAVVDQKLLAVLEQVANGRKPATRQQLSRIVYLLASRYLDSFNRASPHSRSYDPEDFTGVRLVLRVWPLLGNHWDAGYFTNRGPKFYHLLLEQAKYGGAVEREVALSFLRSTAASGRRRGSDPALIRLFRKEGDLSTLGILRDRASIPLMRAGVESPDPHERAIAMNALASVPDRGAGPLLIPHLADRIELQEGTPDGKFGPAAWALRCIIQPRDVPLLLEFLEAHDGLANAFAINLLGYFGTTEVIPKLRPYTEDRHMRVREAANNAIRRIRDELTKDTDRWRFR